VHDLSDSIPTVNKTNSRLSQHQIMRTKYQTRLTYLIAV